MNPQSMRRDLPLVRAKAKSRGASDASHEGLRLPGKATLLMEQLAQRGALIVGAQEARASGPAVMDTPLYIRATGGDEIGNLGCDV
eukprot:11195476-Alexandrium_andersonii.AAC.1